MSRILKVKRGETSEEDLRPPGQASLVGTLSCPGALPEVFPFSLTPVKATDHTLRDQVRGLVYGTLAKDGQFAFAGLEPGTYRLNTYHRDYPSGVSWNAEPHYVTLEDKQEQELNIRVRRVE